MSRSLLRLSSLSVLGCLVLCLAPVAGAQELPPGPPAELLEALASRQLDADQTRYLDHLVRSPDVTEVALVRLSAAALADQTTVRLNLLPGETVTVQRQSVEVRGSGDYTWIGTVPGYATQAILVVRGQHVTGTVTDGDRTYSLRPLGEGVTAVLRRDPALRTQEEHPPAAYAALEAAAPRRFKAAPTVEKAASCEVVDLVVAYTIDADNAVADILGLIQLAVDETNQSYANSDIAHRVNLAHAYATPYSDSGDMVLDRNRFVSNGDGHMDEIHALRATYGGDVAVLIQNSGQYCGIAAAIYANDSTAFAVAAQSCATGYYTFGHEIGHLHGARHNTQADPNTTPFAYGHGYQHSKRGTSWRTVMAYNCNGRGCPRLPYWSNPDVLYGGEPMGTASTNDNARVLDETACHIGGFR